MTNNKPNSSCHQSSSSRFAKLDASYTYNLKNDMSSTTTTRSSSSSTSNFMWPRLVFRFQWNGWMIQPAPSSFSKSTKKETTTTKFPTTNLYYQSNHHHHHRPVSPTTSSRQKTCTQWLDEYDDFFFESDL